jgi:hypothetical protein
MGIERLPFNLGAGCFCQPEVDDARNGLPVNLLNEIEIEEKYCEIAAKRLA